MIKAKARTKRNKDLRSKPDAENFLNKNPKVKARFQAVIGYFSSLYHGDNEGYINYKDGAEYAFNCKKDSCIIVLIANLNSVRIKIYTSRMKLTHDFKTDEVIRGGKTKEKKSKQILFSIKETLDLKRMNEFFIDHAVDNFKQPTPSYFLTYELADSETYTSLRTIKGGEQKVNQNHIKLAELFCKWLRKNANTKEIKEEYYLANKDSIDITLRFKNKYIFCELKTTHNTSPKRAIREAIGQLLDYQCYDNKAESADGLYIVIDSEPSDLDLAFIRKLKKDYSIPLSLFWHKSKNNFVKE